MSKRALVTGASSGIGLEFARILARGGFDLVIVARNKKALESLAKEIHDRYGTTVEVIAADLSKPNSAEKVYEEATKKNPVEVVINNAGFGDLHELKDAEWDKLHKMINLNILTLTYLSKLAAADMAERKSGKILNVASIAAYIPGPNMAVYHATKSYVLSFSVALHEELKEHGVSVTCLNPGVTRSGFQDAADMGNAEMVKNRDRMPTSYEVAHFGYEAMMDGKSVANHGLQNRLLTGFTRLMPNTLNAKVVRRMYKRGTSQ